MLIASALLVIGAPIALFFWLDLSSLWNSESDSLGTRLSIVQMLTAAIVGGVAVGVFLSVTLPRFPRPRVHVSFLTPVPKSEERFTTRRSHSMCWVGGRATWIHVQIVNVSTGAGHRFLLLRDFVGTVPSLPGQR